MFLGSPRCFVIVKNLKRNRQDKNLILAHKGIFHPVAWGAAASVGSWLSAPACVHLQPCDPSRGGGGPEAVFRAVGPGPLIPGRPPAPPPGLKFRRMQRWWGWCSKGLSLKAGKPPFCPCEPCELRQ